MKGMKTLLIILLIQSLVFFAVPSGSAVEGQASLRLSKTASAAASRRVTLNIEKSASPSTLTLNPGGEPETVTYTIEVGRTEENEIAYTVTGIITATNAFGSENPAKVTKVEDVVEYKVGGGNWTVAGSTTISNPQSPIPVGGLVDYDYMVTFTLPADVTPTAMRNTGYVMISNRGGENAGEPYHTTVSFEVPMPDTGSSTVQVTDSESITPPDGGVSFTVDSVTWDGGSSTDPEGPWSIAAPNTITVTKTVTAAETAVPGTYKLENTAFIIDGPTDPAEVTITVPGGEEGAGGDTGGGGGGGTGGGGTGSDSGGGDTDGGTGTGGNTSGGGGTGGQTGGSTSTDDATETGGNTGGSGGTSGTSGTGSINTVQQSLPSSTPPASVSPAAVAQAAAPQPTVSTGVPSATPLPKRLPYTGLNFWWYVLISTLLIAVGSLLQLDSISKLLVKGR